MYQIYYRQMCQEFLLLFPTSPPVTLGFLQNSFLSPSVPAFYSTSHVLMFLHHKHLREDGGTVKAQAELT